MNHMNGFVYPTREFRCYLYKWCMCGGERAGTERILTEGDGWICWSGSKGDASEEAGR